VQLYFYAKKIAPKTNPPTMTNAGCTFHFSNINKVKMAIKIVSQSPFEKYAS